MTLNWIDVNLPWRNYGKGKAIEEHPMFSLHPMCKPGVVIEVRLAAGNGKIERFLIGDMNARGGVCDDCCDIADEDIVLRYAVAVDMEELQC